MKCLFVAHLTRLTVIALGFVLAVSVWACETAEPTPVEPTVGPSPTVAQVVRVEPIITPTSEPTATSTPMPTSTPEPSPTSAAVPTSTPEPTATATMAPTNTPTATIVVPTSTPTNTPEPAESPSPTATSTPLPTPTPAPTSTPLPESTATLTPSVEVVIEDEELVVGDETLWGELFATLSEAEVSCVRSVLDPEDYEAMLVRHVVSRERVTDRHELAVWECLSHENAVDLYLSTFLYLTPASERTESELAEIEACYRAVLSYAGLARYIESAATDTLGTPNSGRSLMSTSLLECSLFGQSDGVPFGAIPVYEAIPINFAPNPEFVWRDAVDAVSAEELDCIRSEIGSDRYKIVLDEGVFDGSTESWEVAIWRCLVSESATNLFESVALFGFLHQPYQAIEEHLTSNDEACLERVLKRIDFPRLIGTGLTDVDLDDYRHGVAALIGIGLCVGSLPSVMDVDDHSDGVEGATEIAIGSFIEGNLDAKFNAIFDQDVFQFIAVPGLVYELDLNYGVWGEIDFTGDERAFFSIQVVNPNGMQEFITSAPLLWEPSSSGVHYLVVAGAGPLPYEFEISVSDYVDDFGSDFEAATEIPVGGSVEGTIGLLRESDFFKFSVEEGVAYQIDVSLSDVYRPDIGQDDLIVNFIDTNRNRIGSISDRQVWKAQSSDEFFLQVSGDKQGSYSISVAVSSYIDDHADEPETATKITFIESVTGSIGTDFDDDYFYFDAEAGQSFVMNVETENDSVFYVDLVDAQRGRIALGQSPLIWQAIESGRYFIRIWSNDIGDYTISLNASDYVDDHRDNEATVVLIGQPTAGYILNSWDLDAFAFVGVAGQAYEVKADLGTLEHVNMRLIDSQGTELKRSDENRFTWQARESGNYFVYVQAYSEGTYTFTVSNSDYRDDHGDDDRYATPLSLGKTVSGIIGLDAGFAWNVDGNTDGDHDMLSFVAERGQLYLIEVELGSLLRSDIKLYDAAGDLQESDASNLIWKATRSGKHYVRISGLGVGDYEVTIDRFDYSNDHGDDFADATRIEIGETLSGIISLEGERDFFRFTSTQGDAYLIDLTPEGLQFPLLSLQDADGLELGSDPSQLRAQAVASKDFYIVVSSSLSTGGYSLSIKLLE